MSKNDKKFITLTVEEAKNIYELIAFLKNTLPIDAIFERCAIEELKERIEQASGCFQNGNDHSNQSVKKDGMTLAEAKEFLIAFQNLIK